MIKELLEIGLKVDSAAKTIDAYLNGEIKSDKLKILKDGRVSDLETFGLKLNTDEVREKLGLEGDSSKILMDVLKAVSSEKKKQKEQKSQEKMLAASEMTEGTKAGHGDYQLSAPLQLFRSTPTLKINEADHDFFANFRYTEDGQLLYRDLNGKIHFIFSNMRGLDFKNENKLAGEDSLWDMICRDLGVKYDKYCKLANVAWSSMDKEDDLEKIFTGFQFDDETYMIPTFFRYLIAPVSVTKVVRKSDGENEKFFDGFKAVAIKGMMLFNDSMDLLSQSWHQWTKGMIKKTEGWKAFSNSSEWAVNRYEIPENWQEAHMPESWKNFFEGKARQRILHRVYFYIGSCLDATCEAQQSLIISDAGGTGKGTLVRLLRDIFPKDFVGSLTNECLTNPRFSVASHGLYKHHILINTEYDGHSTNSELFKQLIGGDTISCEVKGGDSFEFNAKGLKMILTSNRVCYTKEHSIRRRLIPCSFVSNFKMTDGFDEFKQAELRKDAKEFLSYCYKVFKTSPFRKSTGEYIVMNEEQEKEFLKTKSLPTGKDYEKFLMKAFSADEDIKDQFKCGDFSEETHLNDAYEDVYDAIFEFDTEACMTVTDLKKAVIDYCTKNKEYACEFDLEFDGTYYTFRSMKQKNNAQFISFMEKTKGHEWGKTQWMNGKSQKVVTNIKLKEPEEPKVETVETTFDDRSSAEKILDELEAEGNELSAE